MAQGIPPDDLITYDTTLLKFNAKYTRTFFYLQSNRTSCQRSLVKFPFVALRDKKPTTIRCVSTPTTHQ